MLNAIYVSLRARRKFPISCQAYIVLCFRYSDIFTNKKLLISSYKHYENDVRETFNKK